MPSRYFGRGTYGNGQLLVAEAVVFLVEHEVVDARYLEYRGSDTGSFRGFSELGSIVSAVAGGMVVLRKMVEEHAASSDTCLASAESLATEVILNGIARTLCENVKKDPNTGVG